MVAVLDILETPCHDPVAPSEQRNRLSTASVHDVYYRHSRHFLRGHIDQRARAGLMRGWSGVVSLSCRPTSSAGPN